MAQTENNAEGSLVGGTIVAVVIAVVVLIVVSILASMAFGLFQYYMSSMRIEAAIFIGLLFGGYAGSHAARIVCDAIVKRYAGKAVFVALMILAALALLFEVNDGLAWESTGRLGQWLVIGWC